VALYPEGLWEIAKDSTTAGNHRNVPGWIQR